MTVFVWMPRAFPAEQVTEAQRQTEWAKPEAHCLLCSNALLPGQRVMSWDAHTKLNFHAACVSDNARGLLKDIAECTR